MTQRLVIFDVDGTLVDSQAHILGAMSVAFEGIGHALPAREAVLGIVGLSLPVAMARLTPELPATAHAELVERYKGAYMTLRAETLSPLYPGAAEALEQLAADPQIVLGIATGKSRRGMDHIMAAHGWAGRFATVQVADDHPSKPHPSMIAACLRDTGLAADQALMVGDTRFDMEMARAAGVRGLGVAWGYHAAETLGGPVIADFAELPRALAELWEMT
ncbi:HAD-IA family hydrolase [Natronohydrobacter thiooxidans]|uniref:HAD-IA family hydrolase n=1 Tax=Natronohydrobacter thiooxidans TaxID=87172 RepID=UPI0008FF6304|nr:HAD-IA family hydrolase [Natronohydrobacter thiooxidans]